MPTITRQQRNAELDAHNAKVLARIIAETDYDEPEQTGTLKEQITKPGDERRLRGIPVVGARGVGGAIPGSRPGANL